jgi:hypothetical protein
MIIFESGEIEKKPSNKPVTPPDAPTRGGMPGTKAWTKIWESPLPTPQTKKRLQIRKLEKT